MRWCSAQSLARYRHLVSASSYCDEAVGASRSLEHLGAWSRVGSHLATRLIWQHAGGEGGDRSLWRGPGLQRGFECESLLGLLGQKRTHLGVKRGLVRSAGGRSLNESGENLRWGSRL